MLNRGGITDKRSDEYFNIKEEYKTTYASNKNIHPEIKVLQNYKQTTISMTKATE